MARKADALVRRPRQRETGGPVFLTMDQKRLSKSFHFFIYPHQAARAHNIRRRNGRQSPLYLLAAQDALPKLGEIECSYSRTVGRCSADTMVALGQNAKCSLRADVFRFAPELGPCSKPLACRKRARSRPRTSVCGRGRYRPYSTLTLAARITLPHFSVSSAMSLPKSAGEP